MLFFFFLHEHLNATFVRKRNDFATNLNQIYTKELIRPNSLKMCLYWLKTKGLKPKMN